MDIYNAGKNGTLDSFYNSKIVMPVKNSSLAAKGLNTRDIEEFTKIGLLDDANYSKVEELLNKGVDKMDIYNAGKNGNLDDFYNSKVVMPVRQSSLAAKGLNSRDIEEFTKIGLLDDANYSKVEELLNKGVDKMDIYNAGKNGKLNTLLN